MKRVRVSVDGDVLQEVDVDRELVVGRSKSADVRIAFTEVSSRHLRIRPDGERVLVMDVGSTNGTLLDGETRLEPHDEIPFERGAKLTIGPALLELVEPERPVSGLHRDSEATMVVGDGHMQSALVDIARFRAAGARLVIAAEHARRIVPIEEMEVRVGRDADEVQIVVPHQSVSGTHAAIAFENGQFRLRDLESANGTFVDGHPVSVPSPLPTEAAVTFGTVECLFVQNAPEGESHPHEVEALVAQAVATGGATQQQGRDALATHRETGQSVGELFVSRGILTPLQWADLYQQRKVIATIARGAGGQRMHPVVWMLFGLLLAAAGGALVWWLVM